MLQPKPSDRFQSASEVLAALKKQPANLPVVPVLPIPNPSTLKTAVVSPNMSNNNTPSPDPNSQPPREEASFWQILSRTWVGILGVAAAAALGWGVTSMFNKPSPTPSINSSPDSATPVPSPTDSPIPTETPSTSPSTAETSAPDRTVPNNSRGSSSTERTNSSDNTPTTPQRRRIRRSRQRSNSNNSNSNSAPARSPSSRTTDDSERPQPQRPQPRTSAEPEASVAPKPRRSPRPAISIEVPQNGDLFNNKKQISPPETAQPPARPARNTPSRSTGNGDNNSTRNRGNSNKPADIETPESPLF